MKKSILNAIAARFEIETEIVKTAFETTETVSDACEMLQISPDACNATVTAVNLKNAELAEKRRETVAAKSETAIVPAETVTVEPETPVETETAETVEIVPEISMLEKLQKFESNLPTVEISKQYKMKCKSEIIFFNNRREMFEPTESETAEMLELTAKILENLPATNKLNESADYVNATEITAQQFDKKTSAPKSAFFLNDSSYQIAVRFA